MKPLDILKQGLTKHQDKIQERKVKLTADLIAGCSVLEADQEWLNGDGNLVDEDQVVEMLENASDYKQCIEQLSRMNQNGKHNMMQGHNNLIWPKDFAKPSILMFLRCSSFGFRRR
ncbi:hypothetical protein EV363DRAFT_1156257 [Boletus edulis]|nr:hypothetical protein EV363DRAFT_1156257 [Boletus edulis]